jgi:hypothetical protein
LSFNTHASLILWMSDCARVARCIEARVLGREAVSQYTKRRGGASRLGISVAVRYSSSEHKSQYMAAPPLRASVLCLPVVHRSPDWINKGPVSFGVGYRHCIRAAVD